MASLETRVAKMEKDAADVDLKTMTDDELMAHARKFPMFSSEMYGAIVTLILRRPSAFPVVNDDPDHVSRDY